MGGRCTRRGSRRRRRAVGSDGGRAESKRHGLNSGFTEEAWQRERTMNGTNLILSLDSSSGMGKQKFKSSGLSSSGNWTGVSCAGGLYRFT